MPRFFFDIRLGGRHAEDHLGVELVSAEVARVEAEAVLREMARAASVNATHETLILTVRDEEGTLIFCGKAITDAPL